MYRKKRASMLGCLSLTGVETPERGSGAEGASGGSGSLGESRGASTSSGVVPNNASRRGSDRVSGSSRRRSGSIRRLCRKVGQFFTSRSSSSSRRSSAESAQSSSYLSLDSRNRLRNEFRQRVMAALTSTDPSFVSAGPEGDRVVGLSLRGSGDSSLHQRQSAALHGTVIRQSDQVWREIQDFAVNQQGDVYVYIPYTHLNEALNYLSQILPILTVSLNKEQRPQGLTREEFDALPRITKGGEAGPSRAAEIPEDCPVCFNPMLPGEELVGLPCFEDHVFHKDCLWKWLGSHSTCPLCREKVQVDLQEVGDEENEEDGDEGECSEGCCDQHHHLQSGDEEEEEEEDPEEGSSSSQAPPAEVQADGGEVGESNPLETASVSEIGHGSSATRRIFIWSTARSSSPAILILSRGSQRGASSSD